jgi:nucleotide-binding universal stress UspA family protein
MLPLRTILYATDFSPYSQYSFRLACSVARDYGARMIALHVMVPPVAVYGEGMLPIQPEDIQEQLSGQLRALVAQHPEIPIETRLVEGDPAREILRAAKEIKCDLIAIGTHGRTGLGRLLMGSVAEQVVRKAPCPVLTVKAPEHQAPASQEPSPAAAVAGK